MLPQIHQTGNVYELNKGLYLLVGFFVEGNEYATLVDLLSGNRYLDPIKVHNWNRITSLEFKNISAGDTFSFLGQSKKNIQKPLYFYLKCQITFLLTLIQSIVKIISIQETGQQYLPG